MMAGTADILVVGAGPAGLALALQARDHGAAVRIVDRRPEAARPSRALILHPRTLEVLRPLGVTQALLARADVAPTADPQLGASPSATAVQAVMVKGRTGVRLRGESRGCGPRVSVAWIPHSPGGMA